MTCPLPRAEISFYPLRFVKAKIIKRQYVFKFDENKDNLQQKKTGKNTVPCSSFSMHCATN